MSYACTIFGNIFEHKTTQGGNANLSGKKLEDDVEQLILEKNIKVMDDCGREDYSDYCVNGGYEGLLVRQVTKKRWHGGNGKYDFWFCINGREPIRIECRRQNVSGSVDDKLLALFYDSLVGKEKYIIIIIDGNGCNPDALDCLKELCEKTTDKIIKVMTLPEFKNWLDSEFMEVFKEVSINESY